MFSKTLVKEKVSIRNHERPKSTLGDQREVQLTWLSNDDKDGVENLSS